MTPTCAALPWTRRCGPTASLTGVRVDVPQAMAFALAHGLRLGG